MLLVSRHHHPTPVVNVFSLPTRPTPSLKTVAGQFYAMDHISATTVRRRYAFGPLDDHMLSSH